MIGKKESMKAKIIKELVRIVSEELEQARAALNTTKDLAQSEDLKSEGKYDTRGIEAGYLAGAQEKRVKELEIELSNLENLNIENKDSIVPGALVETEDRVYFLTVSTGGHKIKSHKGLVHVVSMHSPIGQKLIDEELEVVDFS
jgi:hypothetical protein